MQALFGFISTGEKIAMYTLRVMYKCHTIYQGQNVYFDQDYYEVNLSTDKVKAEKRAVEICNMICIPFKGNAEFELNAIRRQRDEDAKEKREAVERETARIQKEREDEFVRQVTEGVFVIGKYTGKTAAEVAKIDLQYLFYVANESIGSGYSKYAVGVKLAKEYIEQNNITKPGFVGNIGDKVTLELRLDSVNGFWNSYGAKNFVFSCTTNNNESITFFSSAKAFLELKDGQTFVIIGTVKQHDVYRDWNKTVIQKPKFVKV